MDDANEEGGEHCEPPDDFCCPISLELMEDPVITPYGTTYDRASIVAVINERGIDPLVMQPLTEDQLAPNRVLRSMIEAWRARK
jgi:hypothetical protein